MRQEVAHRDRTRHLRVGDPEPGQELDDRLVELEDALVDELHDERRGPDLRDRADLEDRVRGDVDTRRRAQHARADRGDLAVAQDPERRARDAVPREELAEPVREVGGGASDGLPAGHPE